MTVVDGGELAARRARASRRDPSLRARRRAHQPDLVGGAAAQHPDRRRASRGGRGPLCRRLVARDGRARRRARDRGSGSHERAHGHRDRACAAQPDARDRRRGHEPRAGQRRGRSARSARDGATGVQVGAADRAPRPHPRIREPSPHGRDDGDTRACVSRSGDRHDPFDDRRRDRRGVGHARTRERRGPRPSPS